MAYKQRGHAQPGINQRAQDPPKKGNTKTTFGDKLKSAWYSEIGGNTGTHLTTLKSRSSVTTEPNKLSGNRLILKQEVKRLSPLAG